MKLNIANTTTGAQKLIEIEDEKKLRNFMEKRISADVAADDLGEEFKGYVFRITGGNDKDGFPMKQGILVNGRVRLLLDKDSSCYRPRRTGERKRKSVRGAIVGHDLAVIDLVIVKQGDQGIPGLTDRQVPRRLGPKRASRIRKLFNLSKEDDVRRHVIRREIIKEGKKKTYKSPRIQRLVTPLLRQRKRRRIALRRRWAQSAREQAQDYARLIQQRNKEKRQSLISKRRQLRSSQPTTSGKEEETKKKPTTPAATKQTGTTKTASAPAKEKKTKTKTKTKKQTQPKAGTTPAATATPATAEKKSTAGATEKKATVAERKPKKK